MVKISFLIKTSFSVLLLLCLIKVKANSQDIIKVSDLNFHEVEIGEYAEFDIIVQNVSQNKNEVITVVEANFGRSHDSVKDEETNIPQASPFSLVQGFNELPITIRSGAFYSFRLGFRPRSSQSYYDTLSFSYQSNLSNVTTILQDTSRLVGKGIKATIPHNSFNFGRRNVNGGFLGNIILRNSGLVPAQVTGLFQATGQVSELQIRNMELLQKTVLNPNDSFTLAVTYLPKKIGESKAEYILQTNKNYLKIKIELLGTGIKPILYTEDNYLGLIEFNKETQTKIPFFIDNSEFADSVTITELQLQSDSVTTNNGNAEQDFKILNLYSNKSQTVQLPYTLGLKTNDTLWANILFTPRDTGYRKANLKAIANNGLEAASNLACRAEHTFLEAQANIVENLCVPENGLIKAVISNKSQTLPITITSLAITGEREKFELLTNESNFILQPKEVKEINIRYKSEQEGRFYAALELYNTSTKTNQLKINLFGSSVKYSAKTELTSGKTSYNYFDTLNISAGANTIFNTLNSKEIEFVLTYNPESMRFVGLQQINKNYSIIESVDTLLGKIVLNLKFNEGTQLLENPINMRFIAKLTKQKKSEFSLQAQSKDFSCITHSGSNFEATLIEYCINDSLDNNNFMVCSPTPNPFSQNTFIKYILPTETHVKAVLCDLQGKEMLKIIDKIEPEGVRELSLKDIALPQGTYFMRLWVGSNYKIYKLVKIGR